MSRINKHEQLKIRFETTPNSRRDCNIALTEWDALPKLADVIMATESEHK